MPFDDLTQFLQAASDAGELERISAPLSPDQEIAALTHQICREFQDRSPVLLFENPAGSPVPVVTNLLGNRQRFLRALGVGRLEEVVERLRSALSPVPANRDWSFRIGGTSNQERGKFAPRTLRRGLAQQVVKLGKEIDLRSLPVLRSWRGETGRLLTAAQVISESGEGRTALEQISVEVVDSQSLLFHWNESGLTFRNWQERAEDARQLSVVLSLGGDPLLNYVASLPMPAWMDPWFFAGLLRQESLNLVRARSVELNVPADAEILIEGFLEATSPEGSGSSSGPSGTIQHRTALPVMTVTAVTHRANPIYPAQVRAMDVSEELVCSELTELLLLNILRMTHPHVTDFHLPGWGGHRRAMVVSTHACTRAEVDQLIHAVCGLPLTSETRCLIVVPGKIDVRNMDAVWREVGFTQSFAPGQLTADSSGTRLILDATSSQRLVPEQARCLPSTEVLASLARHFGTGTPVDSRAAVESELELGEGA